MDFYKRASFICINIPYGRVASYGQIARLCGRPQNARPVGYALKMGLLGDVPAHRIVNSNGFLSGAKSFENEYTQKNMLYSEGIDTDNSGKVNLKLFGWNVTTDEKLYFIDYFERNGI